jgi:hypothetical protein
MAIAISTGLKNQLLDSALNTGAGDDFNSGILEIRTGAAPGPDAAATGTVLATITVPADAFAAAASGSCAKSGTWQDASADAAGTAAHFRLRETGDANGVSTTLRRIEGTVGQGSGDLSLDNTNIAAGQQVTVNTFTLSL